jgi:hypothetical protein
METFLLEARVRIAYKKIGPMRSEIWENGVLP